MKQSRSAVIGLVSISLLAWAVRASADSRPNLYDTISDRNVFKLRPPSPPPDPNAKAAEPPSKVTLTGITTILGDALALLEVQPQGGKPKLFLTMSEGQRDGDI